MEMELENKTQLNATGSAVKAIMAGLNRRYRGLIRDEVFVAKMLEFKEAAKLYYLLISEADNDLKHSLYRSSTQAVGLVTCKYGPKNLGLEIVDGFWRGTALDDGLKKGDPRKTLLKHLQYHVLGSHITEIPTKQRVSYRYATLWVSQCWNAWAEGRKLPDNMIVDDTGQPPYIVGKDTIHQP